MTSVINVIDYVGVEDSGDFTVVGGDPVEYTGSDGSFNNVKLNYKLDASQFNSAPSLTVHYISNSDFDSGVVPTQLIPGAPIASSTNVDVVVKEDGSDYSYITSNRLYSKDVLYPDGKTSLPSPLDSMSIWIIVLMVIIFIVLIVAFVAFAAYAYYMHKNPKRVSIIN